MYSPKNLRCTDCCPEGNPCTLNADVPHTLHVCHNPGCACHSRRRCEATAAQRKARRTAQQAAETAIKEMGAYRWE